MANWYEELTPEITEFIRAQKIFFVASAPPDGEGYANLSPKGYDSLEVLSPSELVYVDWPGSGNQTAAHASAGGPITLMFAGFEQRAWIVRVYGRGRVHAKGSPEYAALAERLGPERVGPYTRQLIAIDVEKVQTSCGYAVPHYEYAGERDTLERYYDRAAEKGELEEKLERYARPQDFVR